MSHIRNAHPIHTPFLPLGKPMSHIRNAHPIGG